MTNERKLMLNKFYLELLRLHLEFADIDNEDPGAEESWKGFINRVDTDARELKTMQLPDEPILRKLMGTLMAAIEQKSMGRFEYGFQNKDM